MLELLLAVVVTAVVAVGLTHRSLTGRHRTALADALAQADARHSADLQAVSALALHDPLTGLPNRVLLLDRLRHALSSQSRRGGQVGVLFLDLDGFKAVNDGYGHAAGDEVLRVVAARLRQAVRSGDTAARLAGDEFVVVCEGVDGPAALAVAASRIESALAAPMDLEGRTVCLGVSVGISLAVGGQTAEDVLRAADTRMYDVKRARQLRLAELGVHNRLASAAAPALRLQL
ncbi:MAG: GGDEF domain-containing protein [Mycobacteriales bacterium]|nr:GGDEF domain-containing protein [Mycobacteriales bacterium]